MGHVGRDCAHVGFMRGHVAWSAQIKQTFTLARKLQWIGIGTVWPTYTSQTVGAATPAFQNAGKEYFGVTKFYRMRLGAQKGVGTKDTIPSGVTAAVLRLKNAVKSENMSESLAFSVYLAANGANMTTIGPYTTGLTLLGNIADGSIPYDGSEYPITLDASVFAANAGHDLKLVIATDVEFVGGGASPIPSGSSFVKPCYSNPTPAQPLYVDLTTS